MVVWELGNDGRQGSQPDLMLSLIDRPLRKVFTTPARSGRGTRGEEGRMDGWPQRDERWCWEWTNAACEIGYG